VRTMTAVDANRALPPWLRFRLGEALVGRPADHERDRELWALERAGIIRMIDPTAISVPSVPSLDVAGDERTLASCKEVARQSWYQPVIVRRLRRATGGPQYELVTGRAMLRACVEVSVPIKALIVGDRR
jgi:hypothetical protein